MSPPEGGTARDRFLDAGGSQWKVMAENIARCTGCASPPDVAGVEELHDGWMNSPEHRANILGEGLSRFGLGIVANAGALYAVQTFAGLGASRRGEDPGGGEPVDETEAVRLALAEVNAARRTSETSEVVASDALTAAAGALVAPNLQGFALDAFGDAFAALPEAGRAR